MTAARLEGLPDNRLEPVPQDRAAAEARFDCAATRCRHIAGAACAERWRRAEARERGTDHAGWSGGLDARSDLACVGCPAGEARARLIPEGTPPAPPDLALFEITDRPTATRRRGFTLPQKRRRKATMPKTAKKTPAPTDDRPACACGRRAPGKRPKAGWPEAYICVECRRSGAAERLRRPVPTPKVEKVPPVGEPKAPEVVVTAPNLGPVVANVVDDPATGLKLVEVDLDARACVDCGEPVQTPKFRCGDCVDQRRRARDGVECVASAHLVGVAVPRGGLVGETDIEPGGGAVTVHVDGVDVLLPCSPDGCRALAKAGALGEMVRLRVLVEYER